MLQTKDERSLGELFADLTRELSTLVRQEIQLVVTEMTGKAASAVKGAGLLVAAILFAIVAFQVFVATAIFAIAKVVDLWLAALIVGVVLLVITGILIKIALAAFKNAQPVPRETVETIKEDAQWAKEQMK